MKERGALVRMKLWSAPAERSVDGAFEAGRAE
jgi:hypothetical protein